MIKRLIFLTILTLICTSTVYASDVPFTKEDRDRLRNVELKVERLEAKVEEGFKAVNQRIDDTNRRIDDIRDLIYVVIGGMIALIGFVIWDRRTALAPAIRKNKELEEREERLEKALKELAAKDPKVAEALKHVGLL